MPLRPLRLPAAALLCLLSSATILPSGLRAGQSYTYAPEHRRPVDATIRDLKAIAAHNTYSPHEMERYDHAMSHLSQFAERLRLGHFDKGKLDSAIDDVQTVLNKNPLDGRARDILSRDVLELRRLRSNYDLGYRYPY